MARAQAATAQAESDAASPMRRRPAAARRPNPIWRTTRLLPQTHSPQPRLMPTNPAWRPSRPSQRATGRSRQSSHAHAIVRAIEHDSSNSRQRARAHRQHVRCLFDTGKYSLKPGAREKLAKVAGILLAYPGLNIEVGGYTDNVGGDQMNQTLSENRAGSVRDYLVQQGVVDELGTAKRLWQHLAVASNDNSAGRQQNRRVELLVSGEAIGNPVNATTGSLR